MIGKAILTPDGYALNHEQVYHTSAYKYRLHVEDFKNPFSHENCQVRDTAIIQKVVAKLNKQGYKFAYCSEERTFITDRQCLRPNALLKDGKHFKKHEVWFDHVVYCLTNDRPLISESDDPSHDDEKFYIKKYGCSLNKAKSMLRDTKLRDEIKNYWCEQYMKYPMLRLPWYIKNKDKEKIIEKILINLAQMS